MYKATIVVTYDGESEEFNEKIEELQREFKSNHMYSIKKYSAEKADEIADGITEYLSKKLHIGDKVHLRVDDVAVKDGVVVTMINREKNIIFVEEIRRR